MRLLDTGAATHLYGAMLSPNRFLLIAAMVFSLRTLDAAEYDIVIYGGTSAGVMAAVQAKRLGKTTVIVSPDKHLGGLSSGGLGFTDTGNKAVIGGLAREFYHRIWKEYDRPETWVWQKREAYGNKGQGTAAIDGAQRTMWIFEPHVAEKVFEELVREFQIRVERDEWLDRAKGVRKNGARIMSITTLSGKTYTSRMFIDATYEGDLMAAAGVECQVGRESRATYNEQWNGIQTGVLHHRHHFGVLEKRISPYWVPGDPKSGILPRISADSPGEYGQSDKRVQAYCFRMCLTDHPENRVAFAKPDGYDPAQYELLARIFAAGWRETFQKFDPIPNRKTDVNNHGPMSTDNIGFSDAYPEASYEQRRQILQEHERYQKGWLYFIATDPRVPREVRQEMQRWGLANDEFKDNGNWPHQIYVREARRMIGAYVMTENDLLKKRVTPDPIGMGSYGIDSHNVQRHITPDGAVQNEGDIGVPTKGPYQIAYGALAPKKGQADNLLVPVCVSASHIAFGSIRMEPVFMILGESAATAAALAIDDQVSVQEVPYTKLRQRLLDDGQILEAPVAAANAIRTFAEGKHPSVQIFVAPDGNNSTGNGSRARPYQTIARALQDSRPGSAIRLRPGVYSGDTFVAKIAGASNAPIWLGGEPGEPRPVIRGGNTGIHLSRVRWLVLENLEVVGATGNGINCDDGGDFADPEATRHVLFRNLAIRNIGAGGNQDGLKLSGVFDYFVLDCEFARMSAGGSGIDHVGCHHGLIARCLFTDNGSNAVQCKGGSEDIEIRSNRFLNGGERAINIGGSTGFTFFRPPLSQSSPNFEAKNIRVIANLFRGSDAPIAFVGAVDSIVANNTIVEPNRWIVRILQETVSSGGYTFQPCGRNQFVNNLIYFTRSRISTHVNIGGNTDPGSFQFANNLWFAVDQPEQSRPSLPSVEQNGRYGLNPMFRDILSKDFSVSAKSPAVAAGKIVPIARADLLEHSYATPPTIGAFEANPAFK